MQLFNPYKQYVGSFIPNCLMECNEIGSTAKLLWARLAQHSGAKGYCYPKQETLAKEIGVSTDRIKRILAELVEEGFIYIENPTGKDRLNHAPNVYHFIKHRIFNDINYEIEVEEKEWDEETEMYKNTTYGRSKNNTPRGGENNTSGRVENNTSLYSKEKVKIEDNKNISETSEKNKSSFENNIEIETPSRRTLAPQQIKIFNIQKSDEQYPIPEKFILHQQFIEAWQAFIEHRKTNKFPMTIQSKKVTISKLLPFTPQEATEALLDSISAGYRGVFPKKAFVGKENVKPAHKNSTVGKYAKLKIETLTGDDL